MNEVEVAIVQNGERNYIIYWDEVNKLVSVTIEGDLIPVGHLILMQALLLKSKQLV